MNYEWMDNDKDKIVILNSIGISIDLEKRIVNRKILSFIKYINFIHFHSRYNRYYIWPPYIFTAYRNVLIR